MDKPGSSYDDGEVYFRQPSYRTTNEVGRCNRDDSPARSVRSDDGDQSASATDSETFANSGQQPRNETSNSDRETDTSSQTHLLNSISGVLKEVVSELKSLKQSVPQSSIVGGFGPNHSYLTTGNVDCEGHTYRQRPRHPYHNVNQNQQNNHSRMANTDYDRIRSGYRSYSPDRRDMDHLCLRNSRDSPRHARPRLAENIRIPCFTGKEDWPVWLARFEAIAERHAWSDEDKLDHLLPRIEGQAADFLFGQLPKATLNTYNDLTHEMHTRFRVIETPRAFATKFSRRIQRVGETAEDFAADLKMLYDKAHGYRDRQTREEDLVQKFLDGLRDEEIRFEVEFHKEPRTIDEAVYHVVNFIQTRSSQGGERRAKQTRTIQFHEDGRSFELDTVDRIPLQKVETSEPLHQNSLSKDRTPLLTKILERLDKLEAINGARPRESKGKSDKECYYCHTLGHFARECPKKDRRAKTGWQGKNQNQTEKPLNYQGPTQVARVRSK